MASGLLCEEREELGSGGKVIRGRRRLLPSFSPYSRPPSSTALIPHRVPEAQTGRSLGWLRGLISGFGKLFLSVLGPENRSPSPSECYSNSDEYSDYDPNEHEDQLRSDDLAAFKIRECEADINMEALAIIPKSETKLVIEQLLMQETFTRDECNKLVEIIQSRVPYTNSIEIGEGTQNAAPNLNHDRNLYGISNFSSRSLSPFSPRFYTQEAVFSDLRNKAVMEAKKWFEEKKLSPSSTYDQSYGTSISNTLMNQIPLEEDVGSPIEMAKSYMQSLPPWRSPSFSTNGLMTTPSRLSSAGNFGSHLISTSELKKRDYLAIGSSNLEENQRTYLNSLDNEQAFSKLDHSKLLSRLSVHEASTIPSAVEKCFNEVQDGNAAGPDQLMEADTSISVGAILQPQDVFKESLEAPKNDEMTLPSEEQIGGISAPEDSLVFASIADKNNGDVIPENETLQLESITPAEPSITKNSGDQVEFQAINSMQVDLDAAFNNPHPTTEPPNGNPQIQEEPVGPSEKFETSSNLAEMSKGDPTTTSASYGGGPAASFSEGDLEPTSDVSIGIRRTRASRNASKVKPVEPMLTDPPEPSRGKKRKAKKVVKQKKWRG
ncbi:protein KAKU4-like isoform X2 [Phalaenopsis equestris]|uniref:protein KAKU4-like isoform X2 n=1 Tax=Phalaenopsis equestris TaxID=78828 RepID=UPI0009E1FDE1|nr:protein KAKU4-like isoform X2 [Phalaenopsis equestris]